MRADVAVNDAERLAVSGDPLAHVLDGNPQCGEVRADVQGVFAVGLQAVKEMLIQNMIIIIFIIHNNKFFIKCSLWYVLNIIYPYRDIYSKTLIKDLTLVFRIVI